MEYIVSRIQFTNPVKLGVLHNDETEFDTTDEHELAELWWEFCKENELIDVSTHVSTSPEPELNPEVQETVTEIIRLHIKLKELKADESAYAVLADALEKII